MPTTREKLIDWLADLPDNTEIGIEDIYLVAMVGPRSQSFFVGDLFDESVQINIKWFSELRKEMLARITEIHKKGAGTERSEGLVVVTLEGYISPELFTTDALEALCFKDRKQAQDFITEFADALHHPQLLDHR